MVETWERHTAAEFATKSIDATMATMTAEPVVNHVPVMTGGVGSREVRRFYDKYFVPAHPADTEIVPLSRTVGTKMPGGCPSWASRSHERWSILTGNPPMV